MKVEIRNAQEQDLCKVVSIHVRAFPGFLMTQLGEAFLLDYYKLVLRSQTGISLVAHVLDVPVGFAVGYGDPEEFYSLLRKHKFRLAADVLPAVARNPRLLPRLLGSLQKTRDTGRPMGFSELASLGVDPQYSGRGIGSSLVQAFLQAARERGARGVYLTTDARNNEGVNRFYVKLGFTRAKTFLAPGRRLMNEYWFTFGGSSTT